VRLVNTPAGSELNRGSSKPEIGRKGEPSCYSVSLLSLALSSLSFDSGQVGNRWERELFADAPGVHQS